MFTDIKPGDTVLIGGGDCSPWQEAVVTDVTEKFFGCDCLTFYKTTGNLAATDTDEQAVEFDGFRAVKQGLKQ
jgi:hypothetical protein